MSIHLNVFIGLPGLANKTPISSILVDIPDTRNIPSSFKSLRFV